MEAVANVQHWFQLGLALGLQQPTLQNVRDQHKPSNHKTEMLTKWLNGVDGCRPSWNALVVALRSPVMQCNDIIIANEIEQSHAHLDLQTKKEC